MDRTFLFSDTTIPVPKDIRADLQERLGAGLLITRELPPGAMARVFVAHDALLGRDVAVKVLAPDLMAGGSADRFRLEMQHAARLQHPHIVPVLTAGVVEYPDGEDAPFYVMPLISGETLAARIRREGPLPAGEVRRILLDVVDAVDHAHRLGIIHRDLKPDNVFLVGKSVLVSDFGVSKALGPEASTASASGSGPIFGTPGYLAPEQAGADPASDHRADLYSIGVLAYEALTGRRPFQAATVHELLVAQASASPVPVQELRPDLAPDLARIVMRCLEKRPEDRFASAAELHAALEIVPPLQEPLPSTRFAPRSRWHKWVAVLAGIGVLAVILTLTWHHVVPGAQEKDGHVASVALIAPDYFQPDAPVNATVAALVDRVSTDLSRMESLKVVNYMSVGVLFRRGQTPTFTEIGSALGVEHLVVFAPIGDARSSRVRVQLVESPTQAQVWVGQYALDSANVQAVQAEILSRVTNALLGTSARLPLQAHSARARREGAHAEYLAGMLALRQRTPDGVARAIAYFEQALRLDSTHVEALGRLATALGLQLSYGYRTTLSSYPTAARALMLADRAIALDPRRGESVGYLAYIEYLTLAPLAQVRADFNRAIRLRASEADVAGWNALMLLREGKTEEALAESRRALELDPLSSVRHLTFALAALGARRYDLAASEARRASEIEPELRRPRQVEGLAMLLQGRARECLGLDLWPHLGVEAMCLRAAGRGAEAQRVVDSLLRAVEREEDGATPYANVVPAQELATYYAWVGQPQASLRFLRLAFARSPAGIDTRILESGVYDRVRAAPAFQAELQRLLEGVWPLVQEHRRRILESEGRLPITAETGLPGYRPVQALASSPTAP